jgi:Lar family restriction alleviation protein
MSSDIKLLPCPFCGGEAISDSCGNHWVRCTFCGARGSVGNTRKEAIEQWNTRKPMDRIVEQLKEWTCEVDIKLPFDALENQKVIWSDEAIKIVKEGGSNG